MRMYFTCKPKKLVCGAIFFRCKRRFKHCIQFCRTAIKYATGLNLIHFGDKCCRVLLARNRMLYLFAHRSHFGESVYPQCQVWICLALRQVKSTVWIINYPTGFLLRKNWSLLVYFGANASCKQINCGSHTFNSIIYSRFA